MSLTNDELLGNLVQVLCEARARWPRGGCGILYQNGQTQEALLATLIAQFPANGWDTNPTQLTDILAYGQRRGAIQFWDNPTTGVRTYFVRLDMVLLNPLNEQYRTVCPLIGRVPCNHSPVINLN